MRTHANGNGTGRDGTGRDGRTGGGREGGRGTAVSRHRGKTGLQSRPVRGDHLAALIISRNYYRDNLTAPIISPSPSVYTAEGGEVKGGAGIHEPPVRNRNRPDER